MNQINLSITTLIIMILLIAIGFICVFGYSVMIRKQEFEIKLKAAETAKNTHIINMPYKDLLSIIDTNMAYYIDQAIVSSRILELETDEQLSLQFNTVLVSVCAEVSMSLSDDVKRALEFYVSPDHIRTYIKDSCRIILLAKIEKLRVEKSRSQK